MQLVEGECALGANLLVCFQLLPFYSYFLLLNATLCMSVTIESDSVLRVNLLGRFQIEAYCFRSRIALLAWLRREPHLVTTYC